MGRKQEAATGNGTDGDDEQKSNNFKVDRKEAKSYFDKLDHAHDEKETANAEALLDIKALYASAAISLGITKRAIRHVYAQHRQTLKRLAKEKDMETDDVDQIDKLRLALGS